MTLDRHTAADLLSHAKRLVLKTGSSLLINGDGSLNHVWLSALAVDIANLRRSGKEVIIVASGAVALGRAALGLNGALKLEEKQAAAAAGQSHLMQGFDHALRQQQLVTAQLLLTLDVTENRRSYLNTRATVETLLALGAIPIINENDTIATAELRYGDNDRLSAHVAQMAGADLLILFSDVDGLYDKNPTQNKDAKFIDRVKTIDTAIEAMAGESVSAVGSGGMATKIMAAKIATNAGCQTLIAKGLTGSKGPISVLTSTNRFTSFEAIGNPISAKRQWIAHRLKPAGELTIDEGAALALANNKSLLAAGVIDVSGKFQKGDAVKIITDKGVAIAQGLIAYDAKDMARLKGKSAKKNLEDGFTGVVIHRNNLVLLEREP